MIFFVFMNRLRDELRRIEGKAVDMSTISEASISSSATLHKSFTDNANNNFSVTASVNLSTNK